MIRWQIKHMSGVKNEVVSVTKKHALSSYSFLVRIYQICSEISLIKVVNTVSSVVDNIFIVNLYTKNVCETGFQLPSFQKKLSLLHQIILSIGLRKFSKMCKWLKSIIHHFLGNMLSKFVFNNLWDFLFHFKFWIFSDVVNNYFTIFCFPKNRRFCSPEDISKFNYLIT